MKQLVTFLFGLWCLVGVTFGAPAPKQVSPDTSSKEKDPIEITADGETRYEAGIAYASDNVEVRLKDDVLYADEVNYDSKTKDVQARGNVRVFTSGKIYRGDRINFNFATKKMDSLDFKGVTSRFSYAAEKLSTKPDNSYLINNGKLFLENRAKPMMVMKAKTIEIYPDDRVVLKNVSLWAGPVPIFWVPYFAQSLKGGEPLKFDIGSSTRWGFYTGVKYNTVLSKNVDMNLLYDWRNKRGSAGGAEFFYNPSAQNRALLKAYYAHDEGTDIDAGTYDRPLAPDPERYRVEYKHKYDLGDGLSTTADINVWSDRHVTDDFLPQEYQDIREPDNFLEIAQINSDDAFSVLARAQTNNLFETVERKPDIEMEFKRQNIVKSPIQYVGQTGLVNFDRQFDRDSGLTSYKGIRFDSYHELLMPKQYFNWLNVTPHIGARGTLYSHNNQDTIDPDGDLSRVMWDGGLDMSFKLSKVYNYNNAALGINGLRHVLEPFVSAQWVSSPNEKPDTFAGFDDHILSSKQQVLDFQGYNSIDSLDKSAIVRQGLRNSIQTKRDGANYTLADWEVSADLDMERQTNPLIKHPYQQVYNRLRVYPVPWMRMEVDASDGMVDGGYDDVNAVLTWQLHPALELSLGYRYLDDLPFFEDSHLITEAVQFRLNENWQLRQELEFEGDNGKLQMQKYSIFRDLTSWNIGLTAGYRDNTQAADEFLAYVTLTLKEFPKASFSVGK